MKEPTPNSSNWRSFAACTEEDPELFFPVGKSGALVAMQTEQAKAICRRCRVTEICLQWALESGQDAGVWGGIGEEERRAIKRRGGLRVGGLAISAEVQVPPLVAPDIPADVLAQNNRGGNSF